RHLGQCGESQSEPLSVEGLLRLHHRKDFPGDDAADESPGLIFIDSLTAEPFERLPGLGRVSVAKLLVENVVKSGLQHRVVWRGWHGHPAPADHSESYRPTLYLIFEPKVLLSEPIEFRRIGVWPPL